MTLDEAIEHATGYHCTTTFVKDFDFAEHFGLDAVKDTYERAFAEWKTNTKYLTELVLVLNWKIWQWYERNDDLARLYDKLWREADCWAGENLKGKDAEYYFRTLD